MEIVSYLLLNGGDRLARNKQNRLPIDLCQPVWSTAWRYTQEVLAA